MTSLNHWTQHVAKSHEKMMSIANGHQLPRFFKEDLICHKQTMDSYPLSEFLWLLRENGSIVVPIKKGVNPAFVTEYLNMGPCFLVSPTSKQIKAVNKDQATHLIYQPPADLSKCSNHLELVSIVSKVLEAWETFLERTPTVTVNPVDWPKWIAFFEQSDNQVMVRFIKHASDKLVQKRTN